MRNLWAVLVLLSTAWFSAPAQQVAAPTFPGKQWGHTSPAAAGWNQARTQQATAYLDGLGATAYMLVQQGVIVAEAGDTAARTELHSCRKSFLSALIGIAVARNQIHLDDTLDSLGIDDNAPSLTPQEKQASIRMLLEARSGVYHQAEYETNGMAEMRPARGSHPPGTFWYYNNWDFNTLGAIYEKAAGHSIFAGVATEIAAPIGMQDFRAKDGRYLRGPESNFPAYPMRMSARDMARFALLYLHGGNWAGTQVVPAQWVADSLHPYFDTESGGYGYLWWTGDSATPGRRARYVFPPGSFWLEGHLGQYAVVVPSRDLVLVVRIDGERTKKRISKAEMSKVVRLVIDATQ